MSSRAEKAFPRGGRIPALSKPFKPFTFSLFNDTNKKKKKKLKKKKSNKSSTEIHNEGDHLESFKSDLTVKYVDELSPAVLQEGMLVLGIVGQVTEKVVTLCLPGGIRGLASVANISSFYKELIMNARNKSKVPSLEDLFTVGEILPTKVISVSDNDKYVFYVTLDPKQINAKVADMEVGLSIVGSVKSKEDHGYILDFGVPFLSGFLNFNKVPAGMTPVVGKLIRCVVTNCISSLGSYKLEVSALTDDFRKYLVSRNSTYPMHAFIPGFHFNLTVEKLLKNGVQVNFKDDKSFKGFIFEEHLPALFPKLDSIAVGRSYVGTLLYVKPLANVPYFKVISDKPQNYIYKYGDIVKGKVMKCSRAGVNFRIGTKSIRMKCFVPFTKLADSRELLDHTSIGTLYPAKKIVNSIRLGMIDYMKRCYFGATDKASLLEKYYSVSNLKCGEIVPCKIVSFKSSYVTVLIGKTITGVVANIDLTDIPIKNPGNVFKIGQKVKARVVEIDEKTRFVRLTMKPTLLKKNFMFLSSYDAIKVGDSYCGTIFQVYDDKIIVKFFNNVMGHVPNVLTPYNGSPSLKNHFEPGQLVKCRIVAADGLGTLKLSLLPKNVLDAKLKIGEPYEVTVAEKNRYGLIINVYLPHIQNEIRGLLPRGLIVDYPGLGKTLLPTFTENDKLIAYHVFHKEGFLPIFAASPSIVQFYKSMVHEKVCPEEFLNPGHVFPFLYRFMNSKNQCLVLSPLVPEHEHLKFYVQKENIWDETDVTCSDKLPVEKYQLVYGSIVKHTVSFVDVSLKLSEVWDKDFSSSLQLLDQYLDGIKKLVNYRRQTGENTIYDVKLGSEIYVPSNENGIVEIRHPAPSNSTVKGKVVWINAIQNRLCVNTMKECVSDISEDQDEDFAFVDAVHRARIVYIGNDLVVAALKGKGSGRLVFMPRKRHVNDFLNSSCPYQLGCLTKVWVQRGELNNLLAIDREVLKMKERNIWNAKTLKSNLSVKRKKTVPDLPGKIRKVQDIDEDSEMEIIGMKITKASDIKEESKEQSDDEIQCDFDGTKNCQFNGEILFNEIKKENEESETDEVNKSQYEILNGISPMDVEVKSEDESADDQHTIKDKDVYEREKIVLSSSSESESDNDEIKMENDYKNKLNVGFNWDVLKDRQLLSGTNAKEEEESSDEDEEAENAKKKKVRLSKKEREEQLKLEEERLRLIEERLSKSDLEPETADDFDRAVLAKPNSSALWIKYMAFHLQATEIEKARVVARRALKTISFNEEQEKLNVWLALLNLENLYGNEESLNKTISEAIMCNEPYHIHLHMLNLNGQANKFQEMERIGNMLMKKHKDVQNIWYDVGLAYYKVGKMETARHVLQRALPLLDKKRHVELISQFAQLENKYGSSERAQTLYETILSSFPKRVDIWSCYVDMLVKSKMTDLARQVLERATSQHLPPKKMKTLFKKFIAFEEKYGTPSNVEKVRESAFEYVENIGSKRT